MSREQRTIPSLVDPRPITARATGLLRRLGLAPGDRVLTLLPNRSETFAIGMAAMLEGIVQVPLPADLGPAEVAEIAADADPRLAIVDPAAARGAHALEVPVHPLQRGGLDAETPAEVSGDWPRTRPMAYTSGTTGRRKGVHVGVHDDDWGRTVVHDEHETFGRRHGDRHLVVSPLYHSGPFRHAFVTALLGGQVAVLPAFDPRRWLEALRRLRPTSLFCVPTHLHRLLALDDLRPSDLASLQLIAHAGAPMPVPLKEQVLEVAPEGAVWEFYGSTEGQFTVCPPDVWRAHPGSVGHARPGHRLEIREPDEDGVGTVWVHAPSHARWEYWRDEEKTREAWDGDAFTVGDLGRLDDDVLTLKGRPGDLVISGGVNVYPAEVERRLLDTPGVAEAVAFGVPDDDWGERLVAAVVPWPGDHPDPSAIRARLKEELAGPKVPKEILVVDDLPRTETGKVRRVGLADVLGDRL